MQIKLGEPKSGNNKRNSNFSIETINLKLSKVAFAQISIYRYKDQYG